LSPNSIQGDAYGFTTNILAVKGYQEFEWEINNDTVYHRLDAGLNGFYGKSNAPEVNTASILTCVQHAMISSMALSLPCSDSVMPTPMVATQKVVNGPQSTLTTTCLAEQRARKLVQTQMKTSLVLGT
jgi:hypothetical protein